MTLKPHRVGNRDRNDIPVPRSLGSPGHATSERLKKILGIGILFVGLFLVIVVLRPGTLAFFALQADGILNSGTWEDDPRNWQRAFKEERPAQVKVVHSWYWSSSHFTEEFIYFFEIQATPEWRDSFLKQRDLTIVSPSASGSFRTNIHFEKTPEWFAPAAGLYEVWGRNGDIGSVWIDKKSGHLFFYDMQL